MASYERSRRRRMLNAGIIACGVFVTIASRQLHGQQLRVVEPGILQMDEGTGEQQVVSPIPAVWPEFISSGTYAFTSSGGAALEDMSSGTTQLLGSNSGSTSTSTRNIGFEFWFDGVAVTQFGVSTEGLVRLGSQLLLPGSDNSVDFASIKNSPKVAPYYDNLFTGTNGKIHYKVTGSAPNRRLVVEWLNMQIPRVGSGNPGAGTFQMWLWETTGVIDFVYGAGIATNSANGGYTIGLQAGAATNFASVTSAGPTVSYVTANNTQTNPIAAGTKYTFTANQQAPPTNLTFSLVTAVSMTLNWVDNTSSEIGYLIYKSTDGATFTLAAQTPANAAASTMYDLDATTTYYWRVVALSEGAVSSALSGNQTTTGVTALSSVSSGNWSSPATWAGGVLPTGSHGVIVTSGTAVTIDTDPLCANLTIQPSGTLVFDAVTARTITVGQTVTNNGVFQTPSSGTQTGHALVAYRDVANDGTIDFSTNGNAAGAAIVFVGASNATFSGSGGTTDVRSIVVNKGSSRGPLLELMPSSLTVQGASSDVGGFVTLLNGTLKISGTFTMTNRLFTTPAYVIPSTAGIWLNNPNFTAAGTATGTTSGNDGLFRLSQGVFTIGLTADDGFEAPSLSGVYIIEGGTLNANGRFDPRGYVSYTQTDGTVNVAIVGNNRSGYGSFGVFPSDPCVGTVFSMTGGTINIINPSSGATKFDYHITGISGAVGNGGEVVFGASGAPNGSTYAIPFSGCPSSLPNFAVNTTMTVTIGGQLVFQGLSIVNNGTILSTGSSAFFEFGGRGPMTYGGSGTFGTLASPFGGIGDFNGISVGISTNNRVTLNGPIFVNRIALYRGGFNNSNLITLGNGGASTTVVQLGRSLTGVGDGTASFDVSPIHNQGSGGEIVRYQFESVPRTTGLEINPTRMLASMTVDNPNSVGVAGGSLTLTGTGTALTLTNGRLVTGNAVMTLSSATASVARTNGRVDGNLRKTFASAGTKSFEVGTANGYSPVTVGVSAGTFPAFVTVKAVQAAQPAIATPQFALLRYWMVSASGITADLTFAYLDPADIPATASEGTFAIAKYNGALTFPGGAVNPVLNTAMISGVSSFSDWTLAPPSTMTFTDSPLVAGTTVKAVHTTELRAVIDAARARHGLGPYPYTEAVSVGVGIKASHVLEMRAALLQAYIAANVTPPMYTTTPAAGVPIRALDISELRSAVANIN